MAGRGSSLVRVGRTDHFVIEYERLLGARGRNLARGLLPLSEADYLRVRTWFGGIEPARMPFVCSVIRGNDGASHSGCHGTHITLDAFGDDITDPRVIAWGNVAEIVEVFSAKLDIGWNCGHSNGEGLSRVLATARYPGQLDDYASAVYWLDSERRNFVEHNDPSDTRFVSTGCAVLFLNYLHHQLGFSWREIVANG